MEKAPEKNFKPSFDVEKIDSSLREIFAYANLSETKWANRPTDSDFINILDKELEIYDKSDYDTSRGILGNLKEKEEGLEKIRLIKKGLEDFESLKESLGDEKILDFLISLDELEKELKQRVNYITEKARGIGFVHKMTIEAIRRLKEIFKS